MTTTDCILEKNGIKEKSFNMSCFKPFHSVGKNEVLTSFWSPEGEIKNLDWEISDPSSEITPCSRSR